MSIIRPSNINKRLVGTATTAKGGSPGNAGQIGPTKTPYIAANKGCSTTLSLGQRSCGVGCCPGVFRASESFCGRKNDCQIPFLDLGGNLICAAASIRWVVAPVAAEVGVTKFDTNDAVTCAQSVTGCTGWFVPLQGQLQNPGYTCRTYWDSLSPTGWYRSDGSNAGGNLTNGYFRGGLPYDANNVWCTRAFRCVSY